MASHIDNLLEKMTSNDEDSRVMATNDLVSVLQKDCLKLDDELDDELAYKVVRMVLSLLEDNNGEVQNLAVKCLGPLVNKVKENQVEAIFDSLCANMISYNEQLRHIPRIGLKTVISELPLTTNSLAPNVCQRIIGKLSAAIEKGDVSVKWDAIDILSDLDSRFGELLLPYVDDIIKVLRSQMPLPATLPECMIDASSYLPSEESRISYIGGILNFLHGLEEEDKREKIRTLIQELPDICYPDLVDAVQALMYGKSVKTRQDCFLLLRELLTVAPGALWRNFDQLMSCIQYSLSDENTTSNMKIDALGFMCCMLQTHNPQVFHPSIPTLIVNSVVKVIRPSIEKPLDVGFQPFVTQLYECTLEKLKLQEVDQKVKESAIACMGQILATMGDVLAQELSVCLPLFLERLRNEVTRLSAVQALTMIAASSLPLDLGSILPQTMPLLGSVFCENQQPKTNLNSIRLLDALVSKCEVDPQLLKDAITNLSKLLCNDPELQVTATKLLQVVSRKELPGLEYEDLLDLLAQQTEHQLNQQVYNALAKCAAGLTLDCQPLATCQATKLLKRIEERASNSQGVLWLLAIAEIGRNFNLSSIKTLPQTITGCFNDASEDLKEAASYSLGVVSVSNPKKYLQYILEEVEEQPTRRYLLLRSLKELITSLSQSSNDEKKLLRLVPSILPVLIKYCECSEEGTRNVVAECLGKLELVCPKKLLPRMQQALKKIDQS